VLMCSGNDINPENVHGKPPKGHSVTFAQ